MRVAIAAVALLCLPACGKPPPHRVLMIGDSLTVHYVPFVKARMSGSSVARNPGIAGSSTYLLSVIDGWVQPRQWDVIHFNVGMWDLRHILRRPGVTRCDLAHGKLTTTAKRYRANLEAIVKKLEASGALLIFGTTTPAPEGNDCVNPADVPRYNAIAVEVMAEHHIVVDDLYTLMLPYSGLHDPPNSAHFTKRGYAILAAHVAQEIQQEWSKAHP